MGYINKCVEDQISMKNIIDQKRWLNTVYSALTRPEPMTACEDIKTPKFKKKIQVNLSSNDPSACGRALSASQTRMTHHVQQIQY